MIIMKLLHHALQALGGWEGRAQVLAAAQHDQQPATPRDKKVSMAPFPPFQERHTKDRH